MGQLRFSTEKAMKKQNTKFDHPLCLSKIDEVKGGIDVQVSLRKCWRNHFSVSFSCFLSKSIKLVTCKRQKFAQDFVFYRHQIFFLLTPGTWTSTPYIPPQCTLTPYVSIYSKPTSCLPLLWPATPMYARAMQAQPMYRQRYVWNDSQLANSR